MPSAVFLMLAILYLPAFGLSDESASGDPILEKNEDSPCEGLQNLAYSWGPKTGLLLAGRLDTPCPNFKIRVRDVDSNKSAILDPVMERGISDEEGTGSFVLRFKDPGSHVLEVGFQSGDAMAPQCLVSRQPDPFWRLMCESPHPGEAESSFWLESLGLIPSKGKKQDLGT